MIYLLFIALFVGTTCLVVELVRVEQAKPTALARGIYLACWLCPATWVLQAAEWLVDRLEKDAKKDKRQNTLHEIDPTEW